jgi:hypothetical protein
MRFGLAPLQDALGHPTHAMIAELAGVKRATVAQWTQRGLSAFQADRVAVAVGMHPAEVWADWWDATGSLCGNDRCMEPVPDHRVFCSPLCRWTKRDALRRAQRDAQKAAAQPSGCPQTTRAEVAA